MKRFGFALLCALVLVSCTRESITGGVILSDGLFDVSTP